MFIKRDQSTTIAEVVERNTKMSTEEFLEEKAMLYIHNLDQAAQCIDSFLKSEKRNKVTIVGDYDCDGICATAILCWMFRTLKIEPVLRIPRRFSEGYGLNKNIIDEISEGLLITVDNGISAHEAIENAKNKGLTVVILDHHLAPVDKDGNQILPPADVIVDPAIEDKSEFHSYCGAGLAYRLAKRILPRTNISSLEMLAGLATVSDVVPLLSENRTLVRNSLKHYNDGILVPGLSVLKDKLHRATTEPFNEKEFSFTLAPCMNAPGRLKDDGAELALRLLTSKRTDRYLPSIAEQVIDLNDLRKAKKSEGKEKIAPLLNGTRPVVVFHRDLEEGITGLLASDLMEEYKCPAIVFTESEQAGLLKGSARSIEEIHIKEVLDQIAQEGLLENYGGHTKAAGLSIREENLEKFRAAFSKAVDQLPSVDETYYDLNLHLGDIPEYFRELERFAPFGEGNEEPVFRLDYNFQYFTIRSVGKDDSHLQMRSRDLKLIGFGLYPKWEEMSCPKKMSVLGSLEKDFWNGTMTPQVRIIEIADHHSGSKR